MPNATITLYVSDEDYINKFIPQKKKVYKMMRDKVREEMGILEEYKKRNQVKKEEQVKKSEG